MSDKKELKQSRLPFKMITSPKVADHKPMMTENSSPMTPVVSSRKRKQSNDGDNVRSSKIGRTNSKENIIAEQDTIEILDSTDEEIELDTSNAAEQRKIKITKSSNKRKQVVKVAKPENDQDDSIVYINEEELKSIKKNKKSTKKSEKKKDQNKPSKEEKKKVKKSLNLNDIQVQKESDAMEVDEVNLEEDKPDTSSKTEERNEDHQDESLAETKVREFKIVMTKLDVSDVEKIEEIIETPEELSKLDVISNSEENLIIKESKQSCAISEEISKLVDKTSDDNNSPSKDFHDEIVLTDDELNKSHSNAVSLTTKTPKLTPKALARRKEFEAKRIEKEAQRLKEKEEKEKQRQKEKEMREEAKRKEREEKEEIRKREKEEKEKKRLAELDKKEEEKRQKEEEKKRIAEQKEEEKKAKEEEKRQKEEERKRQNEAREEEKKKKEIEKIKEEERKKKAAEAFTKFFLPSKKKNEPQAVDDETSKESAESSEVNRGNFMPFQIREKMRLAPLVRNEISKDQKEFLDDILSSKINDEMDECKLYLKQLKCPEYVKKTSTKTWPDEEDEENGDDEDVVIIDELEGVGEDIKEDEAHFKMKCRAKFLMFTENRRPAFYGTWRKKSKKISARKPFSQDSKYFDYEVDSDEEWEEEEPGESLHGSDSEKEKEKDDDDYEVDDDFFVPHGHLSEDEMQNDDEVMEDNSPEAQKAKLKVLLQEFTAEMKKKTEKIKPRLIGCIWMNGDEDDDGGSKNDKSEKKYHCSDIIWRILKAREMMSSSEEIKMEDFEPEILESDDDEEKSSTKHQKTPAPPKIRPKIEGESVKELIKLLHGNTNNKRFIIKEYQAYRLKTYYNLPDYQELALKNVEEKIMEISDYKTCPEEGPLFGKKCWYVKEDVIKEFFGDEKPPIPNQWTYILGKEKKNKPNSNDGNSKKESREVSPQTDEQKVKVNEAGNHEASVKIIPESPKTSNSLKITNFVTSSPKNCQPGTSKTPIQNKPSTSIQNKSSLIKNNSSSQIQITAATSIKPSTTTQAISSSKPQLSSNANSGKKRVALLMSVKPGQSINTEKKNQLVNQFLKTNNQNNKNVDRPTIDDDVIEIID